MNKIKAKMISATKMIAILCVTLASTLSAAELNVAVLLPCEAKTKLHPNVMKDFVDDWGKGDSALGNFKANVIKRISSSLEQSFPGVKIVAGDSFCADSNKQFYFARTEANDRVIFGMPKSLDSIADLVFSVQSIEFAITMKTGTYIIMNGAGTVSGSGTSYKYSLGVDYELVAFDVQTKKLIHVSTNTSKAAQIFGITTKGTWLQLVDSMAGRMRDQISKKIKQKPSEFSPNNFGSREM